MARVGRGRPASLERSLARAQTARDQASWALLPGATRLAVIDRSPQVVYPMPNENEDLWLLFNGEIYEYPRLQDELRRAVMSFEPAVTRRWSSTPTRSGASTPFLG